MLLYAAAVMAIFANSSEPWSTVSTENGLTMSVQPVKGSSHENVRVTLTTTAPPTVFMDALWGSLDDRTQNPEVVKREVFEDGVSSRRYWDMVRAPPASDRDYVMQASRLLDEATGAYRHDFETVSDPRKPVKSNVVRMTVRGRCTVTPRTSGGSDVVYEIFTDIGGSIPAFLARGPARKSALQMLRDVKKRAEK